MNRLHQMAQAIVSAHADLALTAGTQARFEHLAATTPVHADERQWISLACQALDFSEADAQTIAQAWHTQSQRTGAFDAQAWPQHPQDFGMAAWPRPQAFAPCPQRLGLYAILPDAQWVARMVRVGVPTVQLRLKTNDPTQIAHEVRAAVQAVRGSASRLFINDHWQAAIDAGAYGVHLGQEDLDTADLDAVRRAGLRLGLSSHGYAEMLRAERHGPSYIAIGAVFATPRKTELVPQGTTRLARYAQLLRHYPTVAIGGIEAHRLAAVLACGVGSAAVIGALTQADQPEQAATQLMAPFSA